MLPDFRVVAIAVISTFLLTVSVGFYTSSRLLNEPRKSRSESLASLEDSPISRIALNWPEPVQQTAQLDLDFAVTLNGSRNPVRDITNETFETQAELKAPDPSATAIDAAPQSPAPPANETAADTDAPTGTPEPAKEEPASIQAAREILNTRALEIEPSTAGLMLAMDGAKAVAASAPPAEGPATTALMVPAAAPDTSTEEPDQIAQPEPDTTAETKSGGEPDSEATGSIMVQDDAIPMPQAKPDRAGPTPKKAIIVTKRPRRYARLTQKRRPRLKTPAPAPTLFFPFNLFVLQPNQPNQFNSANQVNQSLQFNQSNRINQSTPTVQTR